MTSDATISKIASSTGVAQHAALVKQTQRWVSQTFFGTLLKQMRNDPFRNEMFDGGRGGQAFGEMYDQKLADRMARGAGQKLVNAIVRKIEAKRAYAKQKPSAPGSAIPKQLPTGWRHVTAIG